MNPKLYPMRWLCILLIFLMSGVHASAAVKSLGTMKFDIDNDGSAEATLNSTGLGVGILPSSNLSIQGNAVITEQLSVGSSILATTSNLFIGGGFATTPQLVTSNGALSGSSTYLIQASSNLTLSLPSASSHPGLLITAKVIEPNIGVDFVAADRVDGQTVLRLLSDTPLPAATLVSTGSTWNILSVTGGHQLFSTPFDSVIGANAIYSTTQQSIFYSGNAMRVRRDLDDAQMDIGFIDTNLDTVTLVSFATNTGANPSGCAFIVRLYDQSGNENDPFEQTTTNQQPIIVDSGNTVVDNAGRPWT